MGLKWIIYIRLFLETGLFDSSVSLLYVDYLTAEVDCTC